MFSPDLFNSGAPYNYGQASWQLWNTHTTYVEQMLQSSPSPNQLEPRADRQKGNINNLNDLCDWGWFRPLSTCADLTHTRARTHTCTHPHTHIYIICCIFFFENSYPLNSQITHLCYFCFLNNTDIYFENKFLRSSEDGHIKKDV